MTFASSDDNYAFTSLHLSYARTAFYAFLRYRVESVSAQCRLHRNAHSYGAVPSNIPSLNRLTKLGKHVAPDLSILTHCTVDRVHKERPDNMLKYQIELYLYTLEALIYLQIIQ
jgi:hypothetical protein